MPSRVFADTAEVDFPWQLYDVSIFSPTYLTIAADSTVDGGLFAGAITVGASTVVTGHITVIGAATIGASSVVTGDLISGAAITVGASSTLGGDLMSGAATTIGASSTVSGNITSGAAATIGAGSIVGGSITSGAAVTTGANSTVVGNIAAVGAIGTGAGSLAGMQVTVAAGDVDTSATANLADFSADLVKAVIQLQTKLTALGTGTVLPATFETALTPGVYSATSLALPAGTTLVLDAQGKSNQSFVFNIGTSLTVGASASVKLINAGVNDTVYWNVDGYTTIGASTDFTGTIISQDYISVGADTKLLNLNPFVGGLYSVTSYVVTGDNAEIGRPGYVPVVAAIQAQTKPQTRPLTGSVPEPSTWAMMIGGLGLAGMSLRQRRRQEQLSARN